MSIFVNIISYEYRHSLAFLLYLVSHCVKHKIKLRILEGTPSHDWKQVSIVDNIIKKLDIKIDFLYVTTLHIEKMLDKDITIGYIPDELNKDPDITHKELLELMEKNHLKQVDYLIMHGMFEHQLPYIGVKGAHVESNYIPLVNKYIIIGHIHQHTIFKNKIITPGSFDRLIHGDEGKKGCILLNGDKIKFLENKNAKIYKTVDCRKIDKSKILSYIENILGGLPKHSFLRVMVKQDSILVKAIKELNKTYGFVTINLAIEDYGKPVNFITDNDLILNTFEITKDNIYNLLYKKVSPKLKTKKEIEIYKTELDRAINTNSSI